MPASVLEWGTNLILSLQALGDWLIGPLNFFTFLGRGDFFFLMLPVLYWSIDNRLGLRIGIYLTTSANLNGIFKLLWHSPRPYWFDSRVRLLSSPESSYGLPSGHAQNAVVVWGGLAAAIRRGWAWLAAGLLMFLIGFSRPFLGVHFPTDVIIGWVLGALLFGLLLWLERPVLRWFKRLGFGTQISILFGISLAFILAGVGIGQFLKASFPLPDEWMRIAHLAAPQEAIDPLSLSVFITPSAGFFGIAAGVLWLERRGGFNVQGSWLIRAARFPVGFIGVLLLSRGLDAVLPLLAPEKSLAGYVLSYLQNGALTFWFSGLAPLVFIRLKLAEKR